VQVTPVAFEQGTIKLMPDLYIVDNISPAWQPGCFVVLPCNDKVGNFIPPGCSSTNPQLSFSPRGFFAKMSGLI